MADVDNQVPDLQNHGFKNVTSTLVRVGRSIGIGVIAILAFDYIRKPKEDTDDIAVVQSVIENNYLKSPSSAKWLDKRILKKEGRWIHVYFKLDAQNGYGAMIRERLCVVATIDPDNMIRWDKRDFVEADCNIDNKEALELHRKINNWGTPFKDEKTGTSDKDIPDWLKKSVPPK